MDKDAQSSIRIVHQKRAMHGVLHLQRVFWERKERERVDLDQIPRQISPTAPPAYQVEVGREDGWTSGREGEAAL